MKSKLSEVATRDIIDELAERDINVANARAAYLSGEITYEQFMSLLRLWAVVEEE